MNINRVEISGSVADAPIYRVHPTDKSSLLEFLVAVDTRCRSKNNEICGRSDRILCAVENARADALETVLHKGVRVAVAGHLRREKWQEACWSGLHDRVIVFVDEIDIFSQSGDVIKRDTNFALVEGAFRNVDKNTE